MNETTNKQTTEKRTPIIIMVTLDDEMQTMVEELHEARMKNPRIAELRKIMEMMTEPPSDGSEPSAESIQSQQRMKALWEEAFGKPDHTKLVESLIRAAHDGMKQMKEMESASGLDGISGALGAMLGGRRRK